MSATITLYSRIDAAKRYLDTYFSDPRKTYFYFGNIYPYDIESVVDISTSSNDQIKETLENRIFLKSIPTENAILAIKRFNWTSGVIYTRVDNDVDFTDIRKWIHPSSPFYVMNSEGNVYKCIDNNNNSPSLDEPVGIVDGYLKMADGYTWKFMFNLTQEISDKFLTDNWIPVPYKEDQKSDDHKHIESVSVKGDIPYIKVTNPGHYFSSQPDVIIRGDGFNAEANAIIVNGQIDRIELANNGHGYTYAEVLIFGDGYDAEAKAMIAPNEGHGTDAVYELGAFFVEVYSDIISEEEGTAPAYGTYRSIGLVVDTKNTTGDIIDLEKYNTLSDINISNASGDYIIGEKIIGEDSKSFGFLYSDPSGINKTLKMFNVHGQFIDGEKIHGQESSISSVYNNIGSIYSFVDVTTGNIIYKENIQYITRRKVQTEKFNFTIEF